MGAVPLIPAFPLFSSAGVAQLGSTSSVPRHRFDTNNQVIDNFSWKAGKHEVKFGVDFHRTSVQQYFDKYFRGRLSSTEAQPEIPSRISWRGIVDSGFQYFGNSTRHTHENNFGFYAQDSFRLNSRLTLNYGLRWDYFGIVQEKNNLLCNHHQHFYLRQEPELSR